MRTIILASFVLLTACHDKKVQEQPSPSYPVRVATVQEKPALLFIESLGHVESVDSIEIRSRIEGELTGIFFTQGQEVKKGDLLFTIDSKPYAAALESAKGALEQSLATLALADEKVKRYKTLTDLEFYSQINYETLQTDLFSARGLVLQNEGQLDQAQVNLDYCWIYAPIDAVTGIQKIDLGNLVSAGGGEPLVVLNQMCPIYVTLSIPEAKLPQVQKQYVNQEPLSVLAAYENFNQDVFEGKLLMIDNAVDEKTGMIKLRAVFENANWELWPGQFVRTRLILSSLDRAIVIPYSAIQLTQGGPVAFVVGEQNTISQRQLKLGQRQDENIIVLKGLESGDTLVIEGQINLHEGAKVSVIP